MNVAFALLAAVESVADSASSVPHCTQPGLENWVLFISSFSIALGVSFFCSVCEAAFLSISPGQVEDIAERYPARGKIWKEYKTHMEYPIAVILLLNTAAHTIGATIAGAQVHILFGNAYVTAFSILFTWLMLQYTEILPKTLGVKYNKSFCQAVTYVLVFFIWIFTPVVWLLYAINRPFEGKKSTVENESTLDELAALVGVAKSSHLLDKNQERILIETSKLSERDAYEVMVPAYEVTFLTSNQSLMEAIVAAHIDPHTRFPVIEGSDVNKVLGYVNFKEMVAWARTNPNEPNVLPILRQVHFVPKDEEVSDTLHLFVDKHAHLAIVQDEQKQTLGIITMEDIVEELVGDLEDEGESGDFVEKGADQDAQQYSDSEQNSVSTPNLTSSDPSTAKNISLPKFLNDLPEHVFIIGGGVQMKEVISMLNKENCCDEWKSKDIPSGTVSSWLVKQLPGSLKVNKFVSSHGWDFVIRRLRHNHVFDVLALPSGQKGPLRREE